MIEVEPQEGVSARKLILETAHHNVITAYKGSVGIELLRRFPAVDVAVVHTETEGISFEQTISRLREIRADLPIIAISPRPDQVLSGVDYSISSHDPHALLNLLAERFERLPSAEKERVGEGSTSQESKVRSFRAASMRSDAD